MSEQLLSDTDFSKPPVEEEIKVPGEETTASDETSEQEVEETTPSEVPAKKNKSNFKALSKANKEKDKRIAELEARIAEQSNEEDDIQEDENQEEESSEPYDRIDLLEFIVDTPGAAQYKAWIEEALTDFPGISFEKALAYSKAQLPTESSSKKVFNTKSTKAPKTKKISELTPEEAANANLSVEQYDQWSASQKKSVNPFEW